MKRKSAGILIYRFAGKDLEVLLVHPGGPFWAKKDIGAWSIPKGEFDEEEEPLEAAIRELKEETGLTVSGDFIPLEPVKQKSGKLVIAWAIEFDCDPEQVTSNFFEMEWPPNSKIIKIFPEVDKAAWFNLEEASQKIIPGQFPILMELASVVKK
ncbi:MAG: NUDIX domain-containing protein [Bacteroidota bacterium]